HGRITLSLDGSPREVALDVEVFPFAIPRRPTLPILVGFAGRPIARGHRLRVDQDRELTRRYALALLEHRLQPFGGSSDPPPYRMEGDRALVDWRAYDAEWKPLLDAGLQLVDVCLPTRANARERAALALARVRPLRERGWLDRLFDDSHLPTTLVNDVHVPFPPGSGVFWYQSCMSHGCDMDGGSEFKGWPQMVVDVRSAVAHRIQEWLAFRYHV